MKWHLWDPHLRAKDELSSCAISRSYQVAGQGLEAPSTSSSGSCRKQFKRGTGSLAAPTHTPTRLPGSPATESPKRFPARWPQACAGQAGSAGLGSVRVGSALSRLPLIPSRPLYPLEVRPSSVAPDPAESRGAPPPPQDPSPLRGTLGSSLRSPAEGEGARGQRETWTRLLSVSSRSAGMAASLSKQICAI